jgi:hypothetical protein
VWLAPLPAGETVTAAWDAGAVVLDRFPDVLVLGDEASAGALERAGFSLQGPIRLPTTGTVFLVRSKTGTPVDMGLAQSESETRPAVHILWSDGTNALVWAMESLPVNESFVSGKQLRDRPVRPPVAYAERAEGKTFATVFPPVIDQMVDQVDSASYMGWIGNLAGANPITVSGNPVTIATRYTNTAQCDTAERYVYERFLAMGYQDVEFDPYTFGSTHARNVIATLPGTTNPERIVIIGGHLDATSQSPTTSAKGANDNASGVASVLLAADILKNYSFHSTIRFIAFTGEEQGLYGSEHYAAAAAAAGDSIEGVVICDMVAWYDTEYKLIVEGETPWDWLMQIMKDACAAYTGLATRLDYYSWGSDHVPFQDEGFPTFLAIEKQYDLYPCYHRMCDTTEKNKANFGVDATRACIATVAYLAGPDALTGVTGGSLPAALALRGNEPNPFNPATTIRFDLPAAGPAELSVYDVSGRLVRTLVKGNLVPGRHEIDWTGVDGEGSGCPSGVYFYRLTAGRESRTGKMVLIR